MNKNELTRLAAEQVGKHVKDGGMNGKAWLALLGIGAVLLLGFLAYRLVLVELFTSLSDR